MFTLFLFMYDIFFLSLNGIILLSVFVLLAYYVYSIRHYCLHQCIIGQEVPYNENYDSFDNLRIILVKKAGSNENMDKNDWNLLEQMVLKQNPKMYKMLCDLHLSEIELQVCLLIRLNIQPKEMAVLVCRSHETISSIRRRLYQKHFPNEKPSPMKWDAYIHSF